MSTTVVKTPSPAEFRAGLEELLRLATQYAALESRIESLAIELERADWVMGMSSQYINAVGAQVNGALNDAVLERRQHSDLAAPDLCQSIQDAIDIIDFAIERDDRREDADA